MTFSEAATTFVSRGRHGNPRCLEASSEQQAAWHLFICSLLTVREIQAARLRVNRRSDDISRGCTRISSAVAAMEPPAGVVDRADVEANGADKREHAGDPGHHRRSLPAVPSTVSSMQMQSAL